VVDAYTSTHKRRPNSAAISGAVVNR
jgi:hypothetical protein